MNNVTYQDVALTPATRSALCASVKLPAPECREHTMTIRPLLLGCLVLLLAGCGGVDPNSPMGMRQAIFQQMLKTSENLGGMLRGRVAFDAQVFVQQAQQLEQLSKQPWQHFPAVRDEGDSAAKAEVWQRQERFQELAQALQARTAELAQASQIKPLTAESIEPVQAKVEDFFARCRLAAFDATALQPLSPSAEGYALLGKEALHAGDRVVAALPLAAIHADALLPLAQGLNPAWVDAMAVFQAQVVTPLLGAQTQLSWPQWQQLCATLAPAKPGWPPSPARRWPPCPWTKRTPCWPVAISSACSP